MPYIITTGTPWGRNLGARDKYAVTSRTAVATLDEARETMSGIVGDVYIRTGDALDAEWAAFHDSELPGTIGPLPDGTVIDVRPVTWTELNEAVGFRYDQPDRDAQVIDAFNAR